MTPRAGPFMTHPCTVCSGGILSLFSLQYTHKSSYEHCFMIEDKQQPDQTVAVCQGNREGSHRPRIFSMQHVLFHPVCSDAWLLQWSCFILDKSCNLFDWQAENECFLTGIVLRNESSCFKDPWFQIKSFYSITPKVLAVAKYGVHH